MSSVFDIGWGNFDPSSQPIRAFSDHIPWERGFACIAGVWLITAGVCILFRRTARFGSIALAIAYTVFAFFWCPRFSTAPRYLGHHVWVFLGVFGGVAEELILVAAGLMLYALLSLTGKGPSTRIVTLVRVLYGICTLDFGLAHITHVASTAPMVPKWIPLGPTFWTVVTGIAFLAGGLALLFRVLDIVAARSLALMLSIFSALAVFPLVLRYPHDHGAWGANIYNISAIAAFWILACALDFFRRDEGSRALLA